MVDLNVQCMCNSVPHQMQGTSRVGPGLYPIIPVLWCQLLVYTNLGKWMTWHHILDVQFLCDLGGDMGAVA